jgi:CubicO group peptidase (beta-lactamase class C family)
MTRREAVRRLLLGATAPVVLRFAGSAAFAQGAPEPPAPAPDERTAMAEAAKTFMEKYNVPGLAVAIGHSGRVIYEDAFGFADREARQPLTPAHLFRIASVTKPITSVAIFSLIEQGRLSLGDRVFGPGAVLATDFGPPPYPAMIDEITIEHLLTHTCGGWDNHHNDPMFMNGQMNHAQLIAWTLRNRPLENPPGRVHAYSNFGYCVLGRVIEKVARQPYAAYVGNAVLRRCGVRDMAIAGNSFAQRRNGEVKYYGQDGENPYGMNVARMDPHGGWLATPADLAQIFMHVGGFDKPANILKPDTIATMTTPSPANAGYAKGFAVNRANNWWHSGSLPGTSTIAVRTRSGFCWAAFINTRRSNSAIGGDLDGLVWTMARKVKGGGCEGFGEPPG